MANVSPIQAFSLVADASYLSKRPVPTAPDGYYDWQINSDPAEQREGHATVTNLVNEVSSSLTFWGVAFVHSVPQVQAFRAKGGFKPDPRDIVCVFPFHFYLSF